jgi:hypothetical protein
MQKLNKIFLMLSTGRLWVDFFLGFLALKFKITNQSLVAETNHLTKGG